MKILQICTKVPHPPLDGGSIAIFNLSKGFAEAGHTVDILAMNTPKHYQTPEEKTINSSIRIIPVNIDTRIKIQKAFVNLLFSKLPYNAERFISIHVKIKIIELLHAQEYDIIQLEGLYLSPYIKTIRKNSHALIAFRAHNIEHEIWERSLRFSKGLKKIYLKILIKRLKRFEESFINQYDLLVPITQRDLQNFNNLGNVKPAYVSPTGIEAVKLSLTTSKEEFPSLFFLGALDWFPNQDGLLWFIDKVWEKVHAAYPTLPLYIAGRNAPGWLIKRMQIPHVHYLGEIEDTHSFMLSKGIMIVPLFSGSGMRIKIIEGMALGKVIMATPLAAEGITVTADENILIYNTENEFIGKLIQIIDNQELYISIGKNAKKFIEKNYDNLTISSSLAEFYKSFLK